MKILESAFWRVWAFN